MKDGRTSPQNDKMTRFNT